uniref:SFRICE_003527 n=1 Tax=Spodoptera frugiperda TaxID=7108 RepID=A0A2H1W2C3_SPOFR
MSHTVKHQTLYKKETYRGRQRQGLDVVGHDGGEPAGGQAQQRARQEHDAGAQLHAQLFAFLSLSKLVMKNSPALYEDLTRGPLAVYRNPTLGSLTKGVSRSTVSMLCANTSSPHSAMVWIQSRLPLKSGTRHSTKMSLFLRKKDYYLFVPGQVFFKVKCAYGAPDGKQSPPPMDTRSTRGVTNAMPAFESGNRGIRILFQQNEQIHRRAICKQYNNSGIVLPSLSTEVSTMYPSPHWLMACAVLRGSSGSSGGGRRDVFTEQNMQPRSLGRSSDTKSAKPGPSRSFSRIASSLLLVPSVPIPGDSSQYSKYSKR